MFKGEKMETKKNHYTVLLLIVFSLLFASCGEKIDLPNQEAQALVEKTLNLPQKFRSEINGTNYSRNATNHPCTKLEKAGYILVHTSWGYPYHTISATEKGNQYYLGEGESSNGNNTLLFKTIDVGFGEITGIAIDEEQKTATVRFTLKAINITPIGRILENNIDNPRNSELVFKKFDNGWQLADQNISGTEFVRSVFWPK